MKKQAPLRCDAILFSSPSKPVQATCGAAAKFKYLDDRGAWRPRCELHVQADVDEETALAEEAEREEQRAFEAEERALWNARGL